MADRKRETLERVLRAIEEDVEALQTLCEHPERLAQQLGLDETELSALRSADILESGQPRDGLPKSDPRFERVRAALRERDELDHTDPRARASTPTRREALTQAAGLVGSLVWMTPVIQTISVREASAAGSVCEGECSFGTGSTIIGRPPGRLTFITGSTITP